ncbi:MAG TPA: GNAT family N-acetyltransferase [Nitrospirota bacterium]|nr:GNAT family N-acetyltransferase [Nitrospirota bacterium]
MFVEVSTEYQIEIVESLAREIWTEHYIPIIGREQVDYMLARFQSRRAIGEQIRTGIAYFLIKEDDAHIGYMAVQPKGRELFLSKIYVKSSRRGLGYGRKAVQFAEKVARDLGLDKIVLTVNKNNVNSIKAYEKIGFTNTGSVVQDIGSGFVMDDYRMEKKLS